MNGITPSAWRAPDSGELGVPVIDSVRPATPQVRVAGGGGGGGFGPGGGGAAWGAVLAPTPELLAKVAALEPTKAEAKVDVEAEAAPDPHFRFLRFLRPYRIGLIVGMVLVSLDAICTLAAPWLIRRGIDHGVARQATNSLAIISAVFLAVTLLDWAIMWSETHVMGVTSERLLHAMRIKVFSHLQRLGIDYYEREMAGRVMTRMTTDIDALSNLLQTGLVTALVNVVTFVGVGVALAIMNPKLAAVTAICLPPLIVMTLWFRAQSGKAYERARERIAAVNAELQEGLSGVRVSQAFVRERTNEERFEGTARGYLEARLGAQRLVAIYFPFVEMLSELAAALVLGAGSVFIAQRSLSPGELIAFLLYLDLFFSPIQQLSQVFDSYQQARVSLGRIAELLETPSSVPPPAVPVLPRPPDRRHRAGRRALPLPEHGRRSAARRRPAHRARRIGRAGR